ncbi:hypothetical protein MMC27_000074 [Xylographa pallens]|nr:hypothetical protein [Xylographa pallens]
MSLVQSAVASLGADGPSEASSDAAKQYVDRICDYANTWTGANYRGLSWYLKQSTISDAAVFTFMIIRTFSNDSGRPSPDAEFKGREDLPIFRSLPAPDAEHLQLVFLRGLLTPEWLREVGTHFSVDPEFFRRHLDFLQLGRRNYFELPAAPSSTRKFLSFTITTICTRQNPIRATEVPVTRRNELDAIRRFQRSIASKATSGEPIVRRYHVLDERVIVIEQKISIAVKRSKGRGWFVIMWFDNGRNFTESGMHAGIFGQQQLKSDMPNLCIPIVLDKPNIALNLDDRGLTSGGTDSTNAVWAQSADTLVQHYGSSLDPDVMKADALYALSELFTFAHSSANQFLNAIEMYVDEAIRGPEGYEEQCLGTLVYIKRLLDQHIAYLQQTVDCIEARGHATWPSAKDDAAVKVVEKVLKTVATDFNDALRRADTLAVRSFQGTEMIINASILKESRKSILQANATRRLTIAAFFFLPMSLITSIFGMNFKDFGQGNLPLWIGFVCMGVALLIAAPFIFWDGFRARVRDDRGERRLFGESWSP